MIIKSNPKTGETSIKLTKYEQKTLKLAKNICRTIAANSEGQRAKEAEGVSNALAIVERDCTDGAEKPPY